MCPSIAWRGYFTCIYANQVPQSPQSNIHYAHNMCTKLPNNIISYLYGMFPRTELDMNILTIWVMISHYISHGKSYIPSNWAKYLLVFT